MVLCVDDKTQIQAIDRAAPILALMPGAPQRRTHDYRRCGTADLFAALDAASGRVVSSMAARHRFPTQDTSGRDLTNGGPDSALGSEAEGHCPITGQPAVG